MSTDHKNTPEAVCPHCGHEHTNSLEFFSAWPDFGDEVTGQCADCSKEFTITVHTEITYSTEEIKEEK